MKNGLNVHPVMAVIPLNILEQEVGSFAKMIFSDDDAFLDIVLASKSLEFEYGTVEDFLILERRVTDNSGIKIIPDRIWFQNCRSIDNAAQIPKKWFDSINTIKEFKYRQNELNKSNNK